uniref:Uncharacterized protein n=1 Tax=Salarias fasciatus TaxID=181472 RepID=A0A672GGI2_SALFA
GRPAAIFLSPPPHLQTAVPSAASSTWGTRKSHWRLHQSGGWERRFVSFFSRNCVRRSAVSAGALWWWINRLHSATTLCFLLTSSRSV